VTKQQEIFKQTFDFLTAITLLLLFCWLILLLALFATFNTKKPGLFTQIRIGQYGKLFSIYKIRTMKIAPDNKTTVTTINDPRITKFGHFLRKYKLDELPQIFNVLKGDMSFVGPRPDVPGFADELKGEDRIILNIKPGITGPASLYFKNEEQILANQISPEKYNREIIWPKKVEINKAYIKKFSFLNDLKYLYRTIF